MKSNNDCGCATDHDGGGGNEIPELAIPVTICGTRYKFWRTYQGGHRTVMVPAPAGESRE